MSAVPKPEGTYNAPLHGWVCFHCGEEFSVAKQGCFELARVSAEEHFGPHPESEPLCKLSMWEQKELAERVRAAEESERMALAIRDAAQEDAALARGGLAQIETMFPGSLSLHDIWTQFDSLEGRAEAAEAIVAELARVNPVMVDMARDAVCTPPEPEPRPTPQKKRLRLVASTLCSCSMTDGFCTPERSLQCRCWRLAAEVLRVLGNHGCFR